MKFNGIKGKSTLAIGHQSSIEVIDLSDSEEVKNSSKEEKLIDEYKVNQNCNKEENLTSNCFGIELTGEEIDVKENPNEIFLLEDFYLDEINDSVCDSELKIETEKSNKFSGISKLVKAHCTICKVAFEKADDTYLRYVRNCPHCQSPLWFQCRKCAKRYKYLQSAWNHVKRSCEHTKMNPSIRELALKASHERFDNNNLSRKKTCTSNHTPILINLDSDSDNEYNGNFLNCKSTLPLKIQSIESWSDAKDTLSIETGSIEEKSTDSQPITDDIYECVNDDVVSLKSDFEYQHVNSHDTNSEKYALSDCLAQDNKIETKVITSSPMPQNTEQDGIYYQCYKCEFSAETVKEVKRHVSNVHSNCYAKNIYAVCSKCGGKFKSLKLIEKHEQQCCKGFYYKCKFCPKSTKISFAIRNHLVKKHFQLFNEHELDGIMIEIMIKRNAAKEMFENVCEKKVKPSDTWKLKNSETIKISPANHRDLESKIKIDVDKKLYNLSKINELLRVRCCNCKVTFEKVEEKMLHRCPDCRSKLLYRCRLCIKFFATFDKAWWHIYYECKLLKDNRIVDIQSAPDKLKAPKVSKSPPLMYDCCQCDYKTEHKWQISQHMEIWHSYLNDDLGMNFTACSKCGLAFEKPEECRIHEHFHCSNEMLLVCEFCSRFETHADAMRIHLATMHIQQLGSISNLQNVMDVIKMKGQSKRGVAAFVVPNRGDNFVEKEER